MPMFGSTVQNGKFAASALAEESALNRVLLPTLGRPTMPHENPMAGRVYTRTGGISTLGAVKPRSRSPRRARQEATVPRPRPEAQARLALGEAWRQEPTPRVH